MNNSKTILSALKNNNPNLPFQTWESKDAAVYAFGMRPIINSKEYFNNIRMYLSSLVLNDLEYSKKFYNDKYTLIETADNDPINSFLEVIRYDIINKLNVVMANTCENIDMFKNYNPLSEGFVITDIKFVSYSSTTNNNIYYHSFTFSAVNYTRYNTITFKGSVYQDISNIVDDWNKLVTDITNNKDPILNNTKTTSIYFNTFDFLNDISCVIGTEKECNQIQNQNTYSEHLDGYSVDLSDYTGLSNYDTLIKDLNYYYNK
jgi:hypothetical protein